MRQNITQHPNFVNLLNLIAQNGLPEQAAAILSTTVSEVIAEAELEPAERLEIPELLGNLSRLAFNICQTTYRKAVERTNALAWFEGVREYWSGEKKLKRHRKNSASKSVKEHKAKLEKILNLAIDLGFLVEKPVSKKIAFAHLLLQDYFSALYLSSQPVEPDFLEKTFGGSRANYTPGYQWKLWLQMDAELLEKLVKIVTTSDDFLPSHAAGTALVYIGDYRANDLFLPFLKSSDSWVRRRIVSAFVKSDPRIASFLAQALKDEDANVRWETAFQLEHVRQPEVVPPLIEVMENDPAEEVRMIATDTLGQLGYSQATPALIRVLQDPIDNLRANAATSLRKINDRRAVMPLAQALKDPSVYVRQQAADGLRYNNDRRVLKTFLEVLAQEEEDFYVKKHVAYGLGHIGDSSALEPLLNLAQGNTEIADKEQSEELQVEAIYALGKFKVTGSQRLELIEAILQLMTQAMEAGQETILESSAKALAELGATEAVDFLIQLLKTPKEAVRQAVLEKRTAMLAQMRAIGVADFVIQAQETSDVPFWGIEGAIEALGTLQASQAAAPLLEIVLNQAEILRLRERAAHALAELGYSSEVAAELANLRALVAGHDGDEKKEFLQVLLLGLLARHGDAAAVDELLEIITKPVNNITTDAIEALSFNGYNPPTRAKIFARVKLIFEDDSRPNWLSANLSRLLGSLGDPQAVDLLVKALEDSENGVRVKTAAIEALGQLGDLRAIPWLQQNLEKEYLDFYAMEALVAFGSPALEIFLAALKHPESETRWYAAQGLGDLGDKRAAIALEETLDDTDPDVSFRAFEALVKLGLREWSQASC